MSMREVKAFVLRNRVADVVNALSKAGFRNITVVDVQEAPVELSHKKVKNGLTWS